MITKIILTVLFFTVYLFSTWIPWYITEKKGVEPWSFFDRFPYKCRKCFTMWLLLISYITVAYIIGSWWFAILGLILTAMNTIADIYTENQRRY